MKSSAKPPAIKIPAARIAPLLGVNPSLISRWNDGSRKISPDMAMAIVDALYELGFQDVVITDILPDLERLIPYLLRAMAKKQDGHHP